MSRIVILLVASVIALGTATSAQERGHAAITGIVASGADVSVHVDGEASPKRGRIASVANGLLTLIDTAGRTHMIALAGVARIERDGDTNVDGMMIGAAVGGGLCVLGCAQGSSSPAHHKQLVLGNALMFGFYGWLIDKKRQGTTVVYRREPRTRIAVAVSPAAIGLEVRLRLP